MQLTNLSHQIDKKWRVSRYPCQASLNAPAMGTRDLL